MWTTKTDQRKLFLTNGHERNPGNQHGSEAELLDIKLDLVSPGFSHLSVDKGKQCSGLSILHHFRYVLGTVMKEEGGRTVIV